ncbi:UMP-CMP kinase-like isoform X1 [Lampetra fluviatilis]
MAAGSLPRVVFVLGPPGSGKGTICALLSKVFPYAHLSAGSLLRASRCEAVQRSLRNGDIVSSHITIDILTEEMRSLGAWGGSPHPRVSVSPCLRGFLLDGFPRNLENAWSWELDVGRCTETRFVLSLECSAKESLSRCLSRSLGSSARSDDEVDIITKRLALFERESRPVLDTFHERGLLKRVDSSQPTVEACATFSNVSSFVAVIHQPSLLPPRCCVTGHVQSSYHRNRSSPCRFPALPAQVEGEEVGSRGSQEPEFETEENETLQARDAQQLEAVGGERHASQEAVEQGQRERQGVQRQRQVAPNGNQPRHEHAARRRKHLHGGKGGGIFGACHTGCYLVC